MSKQLLVGSWKLVSFETRDANGRISYPWGKNTLGYLMYNADGYMSVTVMNSNRPKFSSSDPWGGTTEEKVAAADTYVSYCGRYEIQQDTVIHHVELSFFPNWIGEDQKRILSIEDDRLSLSSPPSTLAGVEQTIHLIWERVNRS